MKKKYKVIILVAIAAVCVAAAAVQMLWPLSVEMETLRPGRLSDSFTAEGRVTPQNSVLLNATATGIVEALPFTAGMAVAAGEQLIITRPGEATETVLQQEQLRQQLATAEYQQRLLSESDAQYKTALNLAESNADLARREYEAAQEVEREIGGIYSERDLADLENAVLLADEAVQALKSQNPASGLSYYGKLIDSTKKQLAALDDEGAQPLLAPFDGIIWESYVEAGAYIIKNQPLFKFYQSGPMLIEVSLSAKDSLALQLGAQAKIELDDGSSFTATVSFISPVAEQMISGTGLPESRCMVRLSPDNLPENLGAGHQLDVIFTTAIAEQALSVPASCIVPVEGGSAVYVDAGGKAQLMKIETGLRSGGRVEVLSGLEAGALIIINPYDAGISEGKRVKAAQ